MGHEVWSNKLDSIYDIKVEGDSNNPYNGQLTIHKQGKLIHEEPVGIAYGAPFGPDAMDVAEWEEKCIKVVDNLPKEQLISSENRLEWNSRSGKYTFPRR